MVIVLSPSAAGAHDYSTASCASLQEKSEHVVAVDFASQKSPAQQRLSLRRSLRQLLHRFIPWHRKAHEAKEDPESSAMTSRPSVSLIEQSIAVMRTSSIRSLGRSFRKQSRVDMLEETWEDWLEQYQTGTMNLSMLSRPVCFCGFGHMAPPYHKDEVARLRSVDSVNDRRIWRAEREWLDERLRRLLAKYRLKSATVSLIEKTCQNVLFDIGLNKRFPMIGRELSLDAHTILSDGYFTLLDAGTDWRTRLSPLVHGPPFIKFYIGVPIFINSQPVGCLAAFDPYLKAQVPKELVDQLTAISQELSARLQSRADEQRILRGKARVQWADEDDGDSVSTLTVMSMASGSTGISVPSNTADLALVSSLSGANGSACLQESGVLPLFGPQTCHSILQPYEVFESLLRCRSIPQAIKKACRIVWQNLGSELVYVVEVRLQRKILLPTSDIDKLRNGTALNSIAEAEEVSESGSGVKARLVSFYGPQLGFDAEAEIVANKEVFRTAIVSKYGIKFTASENATTMLQSTVLMPFRRKRERITRNKQVPTTGDRFAACNVISDGFVMGASVSHTREFSPGDVVFMKKVVRAIENILTCRDEQRAMG